jgi:hypothetical protein
LLFLGEAGLLAGQVPGAAQTARQALEQARSRRERGWEAWILRLLGDVVHHREPAHIARAGHLYQESLGLAEELGMRPLVARCHLSIGKLYQRPGTRQEAREHLATATTMYRKMDMRFWWDQAEAEMAALG